jgi:hypothetical protein
VLLSTCISAPTRFPTAAVPPAHTGDIVAKCPKQGLKMSRFWHVSSCYALATLFKVSISCPSLMSSHALQIPHPHSTASAIRPVHISAPQQAKLNALAQFAMHLDMHSLTDSIRPLLGLLLCSYLVTGHGIVASTTLLCDAKRACRAD